MFAFSDSSIEKLATKSAINRRRNTRVRYPHIGAVGELPQVFKEGQIVSVRDISTGGLCIFDYDNIFSKTVGEEFDLKLRWQDSEDNIHCQLVGYTDERLHIQFKNINTKSQVRLSMILKPGFLGTKFHMVPNFKEKLDADEMWIGPTGEWLTFYKTHFNEKLENYGEMNYGRVCLSLSRSTPPRYNESSQKFTKGQLASKTIINELLIVLSNFQSPTIRVKELIENLSQQYQQL